MTHFPGFQAALELKAEIGSFDPGNVDVRNDQAGQEHARPSGAAGLLV